MIIHDTKGSDKSSTVLNFINILRAAFAPIFFCQKLQNQTVSRENQLKALMYKKGLRKMLMKLAPDAIQIHFALFQRRKS